MPNKDLIPILEDAAVMLQNLPGSIISLVIHGDTHPCAIHVLDKDFFFACFADVHYIERFCIDFPWEVYAENSNHTVKVFCLITQEQYLQGGSL